MDLIEALRTTGSIRDFTDDPVSDETLWRILDSARFAPSAVNRQGWRVIIVRDEAVRVQLRDLYLDGWFGAPAPSEAHTSGDDPDAKSAAAIERQARRAAAAAAAGNFGANFHALPALMAIWVDRSKLTPEDRPHDRLAFIAGTSIYPFVWSVLLAARNEGLAGVLTTMHLYAEAEIAALLNTPDQWSLAAVLAIGYPIKPTKRLNRAPVEEFATIDRSDGPPLSTPPTS